MMPVASVGICTLEEAVTSSTPYGLTLLWETLHLQIGHTGKCCDPGSSGPPRYGSPSGHQVQRDVMLFQLRILGSAALTTMLFLASSRGSAVASGAVGVLSGAPRPSG